MSLIRINRNPSGASLRLFSAAWILFGGWGGYMAWRVGATTLADTIWATVAITGIAGLVSPPSIRPIFIGLSIAAFPIGFVVSHVILGVVFYLVMTPIGLCMRLAGRDPLERRRDPGAKSYWKTREGNRPATDYFRQH
jgi:hypothetical protein